MHIITQHYRSSSSQAHRVFTTGRRFFKMAAALHPIILFKGMTSDNKNPGGLATLLNMQEMPNGVILAIIFQR